ncbi:MAG TPA: hypothetical protein VFC36_00790 [Paludibacter sp.]|nr:hypothetical protein [Paludibacter sp.]
MKQFIICPNCGAIELATIEETVPFWSYIHDCAKCNYCTMESEWEPAKAISIKQPWSSFIALGYKDIENRTWKTNFRGRVLIHVGADKKLHPNLTRDQCDKLYKYFTGIGTQPKQYSAIIGSVEIVDCIQNSPSIWAEPDCWHWVLKDPVLFEKPILNVKGKLSYFIPQLPQDV